MMFGAKRTNGWQNALSFAPVPQFPENTPVTIEDFRTSGWADEVEKSDGTGYGMWQSLSLAAKAAIAGGRLSQGRVLWLMADACSLRLAPQSVTEWLRPGVVTSVGRSISPSEFSPEDAALLGEIAPEVTNDALRARLADLAWLVGKPRRPDDALLAIDAYRATPITVDVWVHEGREFWERAFVLCRMLGKGCDTRAAECEAAVAKALDGATDAEGFLALWLSEVLVNCRLTAELHAKIATKLETMSRTFDQAGQIERARRYSEGAIVWFQRSGQLAKADEMTAFLAETWAREARTKSEAAVPSNAIAASFHEQAIRIYRMIPRKRRAALNVEERLAEVHRLMSEAGENSLGEMARIYSDGVNLAELVERTVTEVRGKELGEAMKAFTVLKTRTIAERRAAAETALRTTPLRRLFGSCHIRSDGRVVARLPAIDFDDRDSADYQSVLWAEMLAHYRVEVQVTVHAIILPALEVILLEHRITERELIELAYASSIVPQERELLFARGLLCGFDRDFATSIHVLAPQVEHLVRWHLKAAGVRTTTLDIKGIETENGLSTLMELPETAGVFGEELVFEIEALFCDPLGGNLRNEVAHGLLSFAECASIWSVYAWWLVLGLVLKSFWNAQRRAPQAGEKPT